MDFKDVSHREENVVLMQELKANAQRRNREAGQTVHDHPSPDTLITAFLEKKHNEVENATTETSELEPRVTIIETLYPPCAASYRQLSPIPISKLVLETHHRGRSTFVRIVTRPWRGPRPWATLLAVVEDEEGTAVVLRMSFVPEEDVIPADEYLRLGSVLRLKEPYFKRLENGWYCLDVHHVTDVQWFDETEEEVPSQWRKEPPDEGSESIRRRGNEAVERKAWAEASRLYESALKIATTPEEQRLASLNLSLAYLRLGLPERALARACVSGGGRTSTSEKAFFRQARSQYEMGTLEVGAFGSCVNTLLSLRESWPRNRAAEDLQQRAFARIQEERTGNYSFLQMYEQAKMTPPLIDCATFSAPVEVDESSRGAFTTRRVAAGELLLCEKAFAYSYADDDDASSQKQILMNTNTSRVVAGGQARLLADIVQKRRHNWDLTCQFQDLDAGAGIFWDHKNASGPEVDSFVVESIISCNAFGCPRTSHDDFHNSSWYEVSSEYSDREARGFSNCGIWILASHINHCCIGNCQRSFIGDMQIIRATKDLEAGTELLFPYRQPQLLESYQDVRRSLSKWSAYCTCQLCQLRNRTSSEALHKRKALHEELRQASQDWRTVDIPRVKLLVEEMKKTYPVMGSNQIRLELWSPYYILSYRLGSTGNLRESFDMMINAFKALGYDIIATLPDEEGTPATFEIKQWGLVNKSVPRAFIMLDYCCKELCPELCAVVTAYGKLSYRMVVGEGNTAHDSYPSFE